MQVGSFDLI